MAVQLILLEDDSYVFKYAMSCSRPSAVKSILYPCRRMLVFNNLQHGGNNHLSFLWIQLTHTQLKVPKLFARDELWFCSHLKGHSGRLRCVVYDDPENNRGTDPRASARIAVPVGSATVSPFCNLIPRVGVSKQASPSTTYTASTPE